MREDDIEWQTHAETERLARGIAEETLILTFDAEAPAPVLPPRDAPVSVVRPVRLPFDVDEAARKLAEQHGVPVSVLLRDWIVAGLESASGVTPDPVAELRRSLDVAQRALNRIAEVA